MAVSLEKGAAKTLVGAAGVPTPAYQEIEAPRFDLLLELPVAAKPVREGSSVGIRTTSILRDCSSVQQRVSTDLEAAPGGPRRSPGRR
jgi:D-alanine-D-alanine ligase-like ATP-grasp enzyme